MNRKPKVSRSPGRHAKDFARVALGDSRDPVTSRSDSGSVVSPASERIIKETTVKSQEAPFSFLGGCEHGST